jgi:predicted small integral membrane protein
MRARRVLAPTLLPALLPSAALAQAKAGWGNVGQQEEPAFSWTQPMFGDFWMAWTPATMAFFILLFAAIALMGVLEWRRPGGAPRHGVLGLDTTRGDRLFITLRGSAYILLGWLALMSTPIWGGLALCAAWGAFVFIKV